MGSSRTRRLAVIGVTLTGGLVLAACSTTTAGLPSPAVFTNISNTACTLSGFPAVVGIDSHGDPVARAVDSVNGLLGACGCSGPPVVVLRPGEIGTSIVEGIDLPGGSCGPFADGIGVTPPHTTQYTFIKAAPYSCGFTVSPIVRNEL